MASFTVRSGESPARALTPWLPALRPRPAAPLRLFCFPYAGGSAAVFNAWSSALPHIEVRALHLPGRTTRLREAPLTRLTDLVDRVTVELLPLLDRPFAFFGHSLGALAAFEVARRLQRDGHLTPSRLYVSGRRAPHLPVTDGPEHAKTDADLIARLRDLRGTPPEVLDNPALMNLFLPSIRADFAMLRTYEFVPSPPLPCPIVAFGGVEDEESDAGLLEAWEQHTVAAVSVRRFPGDHFFLHTATASVVAAVADSLSVLTPF